MGNKLSKKSNVVQDKESLSKRNEIQTFLQNTPQRRWNSSQKTIEDLKQLMGQENQWPQIVRHFLRKITNKQQYQRYLRAILEQILQRAYDPKNQIIQQKLELKIEQKVENSLSEEIKPSTNKKLNIYEQINQIKAQNIAKREPLQRFNFYKTKLEQSYFVISHEKGGIRENIGEIQFQASLKQLQSENNTLSNNLQQFGKMIPQLMLSQLYQYSSVKQKYMNEMFMQLNIKAYNSLQQFANLLIQEFIVVQDQFNLSKFIVEYDVMIKSLIYLQTCAKMMDQQEKANIFDKIKKIKEDPTFHYIQMCRIFLKYKNVQSAQVIILNLIQKGYHLSQKQLRFYFYLEAYHIFLYGINYSFNQFHQYKKKNHEENHNLNGSFLPFNNCFEQLQIQQIIEMFLSVRPYSQIEQIKKCFQMTLGLYEPQKGEYLFLKHLKKYALSDRANLVITIEALKNHLLCFEQQNRQEIELQFLHRLSLQLCNSIIDYQKHVIDLMRMYKFSKQGYEFVKILFKVSSILNKFEISVKVSELCQFLFYNRKLSSFLKFKCKILEGIASPKATLLQQLQFQALIIIKKVITRYFTLGQSRQQVVFIIEDKFDEQCFEYSTKQIESLFILTQYLHVNLFEGFIPLQQLHQLLFQHMLYFYKYDQVQLMLKDQNLLRYMIQVQVIKMLMIQNVRQMLIKTQKQISVISQDIKKQLKIIQRLLLSSNYKNNNNNNNKSKLQQQDEQYNRQQNKQVNIYNNEMLQQQRQQLQSIRGLFRLLIKLDFYSISLNQQIKQNININLLYFLIQHYQHQIEVFDYDQLYQLIIIIESKLNHINYNQINQRNSNNNSNNKNTIINQNKYIQSSTSSSSFTNNHNQLIVTNQYLKFKIDLAHKAFEIGKIKFGQLILKQVLIYQPPWISSQIIKIIQKTPHSAAINHSFLNIAFQYCVKGQDLIYLLQVWKQKINQKHKKTGQNITSLFQSTKKYIVVDDSYVKDQKQYRNLVAQISFNDQTLKSRDYQLFFTLLGTQPERAFYTVYNKGLDIVKIQILLKQGMKQGIFNIQNVTKIFFKLLYFMVLNQKNKLQNKQKVNVKASYIKFKNLSIQQVVNSVQGLKLLELDDKNKIFQKQIPFILLKKMYKGIKSLLVLPSQFISNYLQNPSNINNDSQDNQYLYMFIFDQNYRQKHLISLKDEPMGKSDIKLYRQVCFINGLNILDLIIFNLTNQLNTLEHNASNRIFQNQKTQNILQKIVTWTQNDSNLVHEILLKLIQKIFSTQILYNTLIYIRQKQNPLIREIVTQQHIDILQSLKQIQTYTQFHGLITQQFFLKPISYNPKQKLSQKHTKILKKQLKLRNVFLISKIMYFCYGMSIQVQKQVLKIFIKENQNQQDKQIFQKLKQKLQQAGDQ